MYLYKIDVSAHPYIHVCVYIINFAYKATEEKPPGFPPQMWQSQFYSYIS